MSKYIYIKYTDKGTSKKALIQRDLIAGVNISDNTICMASGAAYQHVDESDIAKIENLLAGLTG